MIKSMTGFGSAQGTAGGREITIEIKSVNNRYLDCAVRIPRIYMFAEDLVKKKVGKITSRGKVDVFINVDLSEADDVVITVNEPLARAYMKAIGEIGTELDIPYETDAFAISGLPNVLRVEKRETDTDMFIESLSDILDEALSGFDDMRAMEGDKLLEDICQRLTCIEDLTRQIMARSPQSVIDYRDKLGQRITELLKDAKMDQSRILTEAAIFADKVDIDEEITRLGSHLSQLRQLLEGETPVGRRLDFLVQELNREANTIGSKANDTSISNLVIALKAEIEKVREQAQNIE